jgi:glutathione synthase/RimK-type ligase-like ATP-grasp enzyme
MTGRYGAMSQSANSAPLLSHRPFVVLGNPDCRRVDRFQSALAGLGLPPATVVAWTDLLAGRVTLPDVVPPGAVVRIEAPGTSFETERTLLALGADRPDEAGCDRLSRHAARTLAFDKGRIVCPRQWYLGFLAALQEVSQQLAACPEHLRMNAPAEIALMFDKPCCQERLRCTGLPVPRSLGAIEGYADLLARMRQAGCERVFVKLAHGSSASGVVAYRTQGERHQAISTVEMARNDGALTLYNSRRIQVYCEPGNIAALIDALCRHRAYAEVWIPKAGMDGHAFDLRVVVIAGRAYHAVARLSRNPMTNLHLLNARRPWEAVRAHVGEAAADAALQTCERALKSFPKTLYAGVDLLFAPGYRRHFLLELNAFGDLLPGTLHAGQDTYTAEIRAALAAQEGGGC